MAANKSSAGAWPEYLIEAWALGTFMVSAGLSTVLIEAPAWPLHGLIPDADVRRVLIGAAMGLTAVALIYSPWGQRSGAHMNPAVTLAFWRLGKITSRRALGYVLAQVVGGTVGVCLVWAAFGAAFSAPPVSYVTTVPGALGVLVAFLAELLMAALMMLMVLATASRPRFAPYTGVFAGVLVFAYISIEAPLSGMSINPARSFASALPANTWTAFWIYLIAPVLGMQLAAARFIPGRATAPAPCAKLNHSLTQRCIHCGYQPVSQE